MKFIQIHAHKSKHVLGCTCQCSLMKPMFGRVSESKWAERFILPEDRVNFYDIELNYKVNIFLINALI